MARRQRGEGERAPRAAPASPEAPDLRTGEDVEVAAELDEAGGRPARPGGAGRQRQQAPRRRER